MAKSVPKRKTEPAEPMPPRPSQWTLWLETHARTVAIAAVLLATVRIVATYAVFSHTCDEPAHIGAGMEWLDKKTYTWEPQHPPLARVAAAIGPYLLGRRTHSLPTPQSDVDAKFREGVAVLSEGHQYQSTLTAARVGMLPFFWIGCLAMWMWGAHFHGRRIGAIAVAIFTFIPSVLAHAGLATTDMAVTAFTGAAFVCGMLWVERPDGRRAAWLGLTAALAVISKFSSLVFLPAAFAAAALAVCVVRMPDKTRLAALRRGSKTLAIAAAVGLAVIWAMYRFSFRGVPAPELFQGIADVARHNSQGHLAYLLGHLRMNGWWYFFPVVLGVKTPLALLIAVALWAIVPALRRRWKSAVVPLIFSGAILAVGMASNINIGVRHILPVYFGLALVAAMAADQLLVARPQPKWAAPALAVLALWFAGSSLLAHPDYLPYFNELAGSHPEEITVDSDLEWGQDLNRLGKRLRQLGAGHVTVMTTAAADFPEMGFPPVSNQMDGYRPPAGWTAIDVSRWKLRMGVGLAGEKIVMWMDRVPPVEKVGAGYYLWYFPPPAGR